MATMNVSLPDDMVEFVEIEIREGGYVSASEVVRDALRLLRREKAIEHEKIEILRREVGIGLADAAEGKMSTKSVRNIANDIRKKHIGR